MNDVIAMSIGAVIGIAAGMITTAYVAPRVFDWIIRRNI